MNPSKHGRRPPRPCRQRSARRPSAVALAAILLIVYVVTACIGRRPRACERQSDCDEGTACTSEGFCEKECSKDDDCPCRSRCATSCGLCIREDFAGPATCFAHRRGMNTEEVLGACGIDPRDATADAGDASADGDAGSDGRTCEREPVAFPSCNESPPIEVDDASPPADASSSDDVTTSEDAPNDSDANESDAGSTLDAGGDE